jgi:uncharacterized membrane-anchored protein YitT (DUF2179 family)
MNKKLDFNRYFKFSFGVLLLAISFNILVLPLKITYGISGIAVILNHQLGLNPSDVIFVGSLILLVLSFILLGKEKTTNSIIGSILYPIFVRLTSPLITYIIISQSDPLLNTIFAGTISGFGLGLILKSGFTTGGSDILNQIWAKYFKVSMGTAMIFTDGAIIIFGAMFLGINSVMYSLINLFIVSTLADKVILGISESKLFYVITTEETSVKKFITENLNHGVTVLEARGGFTGDRKKVMMCTIPTKKYFVFKEGINKIDPYAYFVVADAYEVQGGNYGTDRD